MLTESLNFESESETRESCERLRAAMTQLGDEPSELSPEKDSEHDEWRIVGARVEHGVRREFRIDGHFLDSDRYERLLFIANQLSGLMTAPALVRRKPEKPDGKKSKANPNLDDSNDPNAGRGKSAAVLGFPAAVDWLLGEARNGLWVQRFKGLGEMNAEQLWETTMDPGARRLLRVTVKDAEEADRIFSKLMGDVVEPRRQFIESRAKQVANLDI